MIHKKVLAVNLIHKKVFTLKDIVEITKIKAESILQYVKRGVVVPEVSVPPAGRGNVRKYSRKNIQQFFLINKLTRNGIFLKHIKRMLIEKQSHYTYSFLLRTLNPECRDKVFDDLIKNGASEEKTKEFFKMGMNAELYNKKNADEIMNHFCSITRWDDSYFRLFFKFNFNFHLRISKINTEKMFIYHFITPNDHRELNLTISSDLESHLIINLNEVYHWIDNI